MRPTRSAGSRFSPIAVAILALGCGDSEGPIVPPTPVDCAGVETDVLALEPYEGVTLRGDALACVALAGGGASYIIAPQLAGATLPYGGYGYRIGDPDAEVAGGALSAMRSDMPTLDDAHMPGAAPEDAQRRLDGRLREAEARLPVVARRALAAGFHPATAPPPLDAIREFSVLSGLDDPVTFAHSAGRLRFAGDNILLYVDTLAAAAFSEAEVLRLGGLFDRWLLPAVRTTFGEESDIDRNGRVIVLLTPTVNALVTATQCAASGYVRGFFYAHDLASTAPTSNHGEIFYALVPDPAGRWSCPIATNEVLENIPPTLTHEMQHMISYGHHAIARGGTAEEPWLNEGLSHLAEEIGSLHFEAKYPAPAGRTNPTQLFPDSASAFITPNLRAAHRYLFLSNQYSITGCAPGSFCSLPERSATWLFLRWLGDLKGGSIYRQLVQTSQTGLSNVASVTGESAPVLLGDFTIALWADSIVGVPRSSIEPRYRFQSRNFRTLYRALYDLYGPVGGIGRPFPIEPTVLAPGTSLTGTMRPGTFAMYRLDTPRTGAGARIRLSQADGSLFAAFAGAQLSILRVGDR